MEIHHIDPKSQGGQDIEENGIPLCFDCHADVHAQSVKGRGFTPSELKKHKEQWFKICSKPYWHSTGETGSIDAGSIVTLDDRIFDGLRCEDPQPAQRLASAIMQTNRATREEFASRVFEGLKSADQDTRWKLAMVVEELVMWEPSLVHADILARMSRDQLFAVRGCAAVCYYYLASLSPSIVPLDILGNLAAPTEDWYVRTPAESALLRLARARPVVVGIFARDLDHKDPYARQLAASAIERLMQRDWDLVPDDLVNRMRRSKDRYVKRIAKEFLKKKNRDKEPIKDYSAF